MSISLQLEDGRCVELADSLVTIGRAAECTISFPGDARVALNHAKIRRVGERWVLEADGQSFVRVGQAAAARLYWLKVGDQVMLGENGPSFIAVISEKHAGDVAARISTPTVTVPMESQTRSWRPAIIGLVSTVGVIAIGAVTWGIVARDGQRIDLQQPQPEAADRAELAVAAPPHAKPTTSEPQRAVQAEIALDDRAWQRADFLLVNPGHIAVAMTSIGSGFRVEAKATDSEAQHRIAAAWQNGTPLIGADKALTRKVADSLDVGQTAQGPQALNQELKNWWRSHAYIPEKASLVAFNDLRQRRRRVGFRWHGRDGEAQFLELHRPFTAPYDHEQPMIGAADLSAESLNAMLIQPGSMIDPLSDADLRGNVDYLDYCIYHIRRRLSSIEPGYVALVVNPVVCAAGSGKLADPAERLFGEIQAKFSAAGVALLERQILSEKTQGSSTTVLGERDRMLKGWTTFKSPDPQTALPDHQTAMKNGLIGGSHLVQAEIRPPLARGQYELSLRIISLTTGKILWTGQGDRLDTSEQAIELASSPFLLNTGKVSTITFQSPNAGLWSVSEGVALGGLPLRNAPLDFLASAPDRSREPPTRSKTSKKVSRIVSEDVGYVESSESQAVLFRGLFDRQVQRIPKSAISRTREVHSLNDVAPLHQMRYLVWRLATSVLPTAGRVTSVDGSSIRMSLKRSDRLQPGDRIIVIRSSPESGGSGHTTESVIPGEVIVSEVHEDSSVAITESGSRRSGSDVSRTASAGDLVHRQPRQIATVAVLPVKPNGREPSSLSVINSAVAAPTSRAELSAEELIVSRFAGMIEGGLNQAKVKTVERANLAKVLSSENVEVGGKFDANRTASLGRLCGATHVLLAALTPTGDFQGKYEVASNLRIVEVETGVVVENLDFTFQYFQMEHWKP